MNEDNGKQKEEEFEGFLSGHNACAGCGAAIAMRHITKAAGKNAIVSLATGCMEVVSTVYPLTSWNVPVIHSAFENAAATASGVEAALKHLGRKERVIAIAGDGGTFDIGLQALSGMVERGHDVLFICYDNEGYMNTGVQRSGATEKYTETTTSPYGSKIHGKIEWKKPLPFIMAAHGCYVATANIAYLNDFYAKIRKALEIKGPKYIQIFSPCVIGWRIPTNETIILSRLAAQTGIYPIYEIENGVVKLSMDIKSKPIAEYLQKQGRYKSLTEKEIAEIQAHVDSEYEKLKRLSDSGMKIF
jgi:pyruvate ferredoxin oxidoreductase beta subunit